MSEFRRWLVVLGAVLGLMVGNGPIMQFTFGVFILPVSQAFSTDRGTVSTALLLGLFLTGLMTPLAGHMMDRYGVRKIAIPSIVLFALGIMAVGYFSTSVTVFIVIYALAGIVAAGQTPLPYAKVITSIFDKKRGLALGISMAGVGLGTALMPQIAQHLVVAVGWRTAYMALGGLILLIGFPSMLFLIREQVQFNPGHSSHLVVEGATTREALKTSTFRILGVSFFFAALAAAGVIAHIIPILEDRGVSAQVATTAISVAGGALILGRLLAGYMLDRYFAPYVALFFFIVPLLGIGLIAFTDQSAFAMVATVMVGLGLGAEVDLIGFMLSRYFGNKSFGALYGYLFAAFMLASGLGPFIMGMSFKYLNSYFPVLIGLMVVLVISSALMFKLGEYAYGAHTEDH
jgi:MFS family permease